MDISDLFINKTGIKDIFGNEEFFLAIFTQFESGPKDNHIFASEKLTQRIITALKDILPNRNITYQFGRYKNEQEKRDFTAFTATHNNNRVFNIQPANNSIGVTYNPTQPQLPYERNISLGIQIHVSSPIIGLLNQEDPKIFTSPYLLEHEKIKGLKELIDELQPDDLRFPFDYSTFEQELSPVELEKALVKRGPIEAKIVHPSLDDKYLMIVTQDEEGTIAYIHGIYDSSYANSIQLKQGPEIKVDSIVGIFTYNLDPLHISKNITYTSLAKPPSIPI